ncbi:MAG: ribose 5-phosphate isomerase [Patescibacteria group bacterium]|nr:ribose 5-phosphate isomerase [Patescibacteria group bacterium]
MKVKIYLAADHAGFEYKEKLKDYLEGFGNFDVIDCGAYHKDEKDDYPDYIHIAASSLSRDITSGSFSVGFVIGGSGQGEAIVMNRHREVRCITYYNNNLDIIELGREHNNANAISFGARFLNWNDIKRAVNLFFDTDFAGGRHDSRIYKIDNPE